MTAASDDRAKRAASKQGWFQAYVVGMGLAGLAIAAWLIACALRPRVGGLEAVVLWINGLLILNHAARELHNRYQLAKLNSLPPELRHAMRPPTVPMWKYRLNRIGFLLANPPGMGVPGLLTLLAVGLFGEGWINVAALIAGGIYMLQPILPLLWLTAGFTVYGLRGR